MDKMPVRFPLVLNQKEVDKYDWKAYLKDETTGLCYVIPKGTWTLGRKDDDMSGYPEDLKIRVRIKTEDTYISRYQANVILKVNIIGENSLFIRDTTGRKNATLVDGYQIGNSFDFQMFDNSRVLMGNTFFNVYLNPNN